MAIQIAYAQTCLGLSRLLRVMMSSDTRRVQPSFKAWDQASEGFSMMLRADATKQHEQRVHVSHGAGGHTQMMRQAVKLGGDGRVARSVLEGHPCFEEIRQL